MQQGGAPLWTELQTVQADAEGRYTVFLGAANGTGLPLDIFASGAARWLAVRPEVPGLEDPARVLLVGVPYAFKAGDADTLGGKPASAFLTAESQPAVILASGGVTPAATPSGSGTTNYIPIWTNSTTLGNSILFQSGNYFGIGTTTLTVNGLANIHTTYSDTGSSLTLGLGTGNYNLNLYNPSTSTHRNAILFSGNASSYKPYFELGTDVGLNGVNTFFLYDKQAAAFRLVVDQNGNLGVGTTTPTANLEVKGTAKFDGAVTFAGNQTDTGNVTTSGALISTVATGTAPLQVTSTTQVANLNASLLGGQPASSFVSTDPSGSVSVSSTDGVAFRVTSKFVPSYQGELGFAIVAQAISPQGQTEGVQNTAVIGVTDSQGSGVNGVLGSESTVGSAYYGGGVWGDTNQDQQVALLGTADNGVGARLENNASGYPTLIVSNDSTVSGAQAAIIGGTANGTTSGGSCVIDIGGNLLCRGTKSAIVPVDNAARKVALYAVEAPENWFEDFGSGHLYGGVATIQLESTFAQTVNTDVDYHVFITPNGESKGWLYVSNKTAQGFEVHEAAGAGRTSVSTTGL